MEQLHADHLSADQNDLADFRPSKIEGEREWALSPYFTWPSSGFHVIHVHIARA